MIAEEKMITRKESRFLERMVFGDLVISRGGKLRSTQEVRHKVQHGKMSGRVA